MIFRNRLISLIIILLAGFSSLSARAEYQLETVAEGLNLPWSIAFLPDGGYLVATRPGELLRISEQGDVSAPLTGTPETFVESQGGYFDIMLDSQFATNKLVYLSFAWGSIEENATRIVKATLGDAGLENVEALFTVSPTKAGGAHYGGKMVQMPDGSIVLSTGDGFEYREAAQDKFSQLGKILRFNTDGSAHTDNPFADGKEGNPFVLSYGHRNTQGLVVDKASNKIYNHEHGPQGGDEINYVEAGNNYGWPAITYGINYSGAFVSPFKEAPGMDQPLKYWTPSIAPSGFAIYQGDAFPAWQGDFFVGALVNKEVRRLEMVDGKIVSEEALFSELNARIRDVRVSPKGLIYLLTDSDSGKIVRVRPKT